MQMIQYYRQTVMPSQLKKVCEAFFLLTKIQIWNLVESRKIWQQLDYKAFSECKTRTQFIYLAEYLQSQIQLVSVLHSLAALAALPAIRSIQPPASRRLVISRIYVWP